MTRSAESFALEVDYWRALLAELRDLHDAIGTAADDLGAAMVHIVPLAMVVQGGAARDDLERVTAHTAETMAAIRSIQKHAIAIGSLIDGRLSVLASESPIRDGGES